MSRIDELIDELAPDGVSYIEIQRLFDLKNGYTPSKSNASFWAEGTVAWFRMEDIRANGRVLDHALQRIPEVAVKGGRLFPANSLLVATSATIGEHALVTVPHLSNQRFTSLALKAEYVDRLDMKFVYYYGFVLDEWCRNNTTTSSFASVDMNGFRKFKFPVPPLEVQRGIVRVLDQFTLLEAELEAELEARQQQYDHVRNELLVYKEPDKAPFFTVGELCNISRGRVISKDYLRERAGEYPVYSSQTQDRGIFGYIDSYSYDFESITWTTDGANAGSVFYHRDECFSITNVCGLLEVKDTSVILTKYLYYQLGLNAKRYVSSGMGNPKLMANVASSIPVSVPHLDEQEHIVAVLDKFDALVNDLSVGLPAELAARRKQYEYYRDRLLTFEEAPT